jgi:hypothetical protein
MFEICATRRHSQSAVPVERIVAGVLAHAKRALLTMQPDVFRLRLRGPLPSADFVRAEPNPPDTPTVPKCLANVLLAGRCHESNFDANIPDRLGIIARGSQAGFKHTPAMHFGSCDCFRLCAIVPGKLQCHHCEHAKRAYAQPARPDSIHAFLLGWRSVKEFQRLFWYFGAT